jgi:hypothetical protein
MRPAEHRPAPPDPDVDRIRDQLARAQAAQRQQRREELAKDLLLKLVESTPGALKYDTKFNIGKAVEYTDGLLSELEKSDEPTDE